MPVLEKVYSLSDSQKCLVAQLHLFCQHMLQGLLSMGQPRKGEPSRLAKELIHIWWIHSVDNNHNNITKQQSCFTTSSTGSLYYYGSIVLRLSLIAQTPPPHLWGMPGNKASTAAKTQYALCISTFHHSFWLLEGRGGEGIKHYRCAVQTCLHIECYT